MSAEENKTIVTRFIEEGWSKHDMDVVLEVVAPRYRRHQPNMFLDVENVIDLTNLILVYREGFPDLALSIEHMVAEGDLVAARVRGTGTHMGSLANIPPTHAKVDFTASDLFRLEDGQIAESWHNVDDWGLMVQIGVLGASEG